jgi:hypothetical protein
MPLYPIVTVAEDGQVALQNRAFDVDTLGTQLAPVRDAILQLFEGRAKGRAELKQVEIGLVVTDRGEVAFATGNANPSMRITVGIRQRTTTSRATGAKPRAAEKPEVVQVD